MSISKCKYCGKKPHTPGSHHKKSCKRYEVGFEMSSKELEVKMRLGEKIMDSEMKNISKIDWWTGEGSGKI